MEPSSSSKTPKTKTKTKSKQSKRPKSKTLSHGFKVKKKTRKRFILAPNLFIGIGKKNVEYNRHFFYPNMTNITVVHFKDDRRIHLRTGKCSQVRIGNVILGDFEQSMCVHPVRCWPFCSLLKKTWT